MRRVVCSSFLALSVGLAISSCSEERRQETAGAKKLGPVAETKKVQATPEPRPPSAVGLRYDGLYLAKTGEDTEGWLRFYEDGTVLSVSTLSGTVSAEASAKKMDKWFNKSSATCSRGTVRVHGNRISFSTTSRDGVVDYEGAIGGQSLVFKTHSHINQHRGEETYVFVGLGGPSGARVGDEKGIAPPGELKPVLIDGKYGYVNGAGKTVIQPRFDHADAFSEGLARVRPGGAPYYVQGDDGPSEVGGQNFGYIDTKGDLVIGAEFKSARSFSEGLAAVSGVVWERSGLGRLSTIKWGYIDREGSWVIRPKFDDAESFHEGVARVKTGDKWSYIDKKGVPVPSR